MINLFFASEQAAETAAEGLPLGLSLQAFAIQLITFVLVFFVLKKFAFTPIVKLLDKRHKVIEDGVKLGLEMEKERAQLADEVAKTMKEARSEADKIISNGQKEAREVVREAEKVAVSKANALLTDAEARIDEEAEQAKRRLEKDIVNMVAQAATAIVGEKIDAQKDAALIDKALKGTK